MYVQTARAAVAGLHEPDAEPNSNSEPKTYIP
jgi:hypothetical protein